MCVTEHFVGEDIHLVPSLGTGEHSLRVLNINNDTRWDALKYIIGKFDYIYTRPKHHQPS